MCGRFTLKAKRSVIVDEYNIGVATGLDNIPPVTERDNIAPTDPVAVIAPAPDGLILTAMRWGIIPQWMKPQENGKAPNGWFNARSETVARKPAFRGAFKYRRCVVPASGFYEWKKQPTGRKQPYLIDRADEQLMGFAGVWETWCPPDGSELDTVTILTTSPNELMAGIHDRMPVILEREDWGTWMGTQPENAGDLSPLMRPAVDGLLNARPIWKTDKHDDYQGGLFA